MSDTGGARTGYAYDLADRLTAVTAPSGKVIALDYDSAGRRTGVRYPNGLNTQVLFETSSATGATGRLASIAHGLNATGQGGSSLNLKLGTVGYGYDVKGNIIAANENATVSAPPLSGGPLAGTPGGVDDLLSVTLQAGTGPSSPPPSPAARRCLRPVATTATPATRGQCGPF